MDIEAIRQYCLQFPHTSEVVQWGTDLCFKVDSKLFVVAAIEMVPQRLSFKCTPENFAELCERAGIIPAPYMARAHWVSLLDLNVLPDAELRELIAEAYRLVWEQLPKRRRAELQRTVVSRTEAPKRTVSRRVAAKEKRARVGGRR